MLAEDVEGHEDFWLRFQATGAQSLMDYFHQLATFREMRLHHRQPLSQVKLETEQIVQYSFLKSCKHEVHIQKQKVEQSKSQRAM